MAITENRRKAIALYERKLIDIRSRARKTQLLRDQVFENREVATAYFGEHGEDGVRELLSSINGVADSNQLDFIQNLSPSEAFEVLVSYATLRASQPAPEEETKTIKELMIESLAASERLNKHPDSPYSQDPKYPLQPSPSGNVTVSYPEEDEQLDQEE